LSNSDKRNSQSRTAIVAGINRYESDSAIQTLNGAENDAKEVYERLQSNGKFEISNSQFLLGGDATRKNILKAVSDVFRKDVSYDVVALYFSGHGIVDKNKAGYIAPYDMDPEDPFVSGINMEDLRTVIQESKNNASVIMLLDCCHAGIAAKDKIRSGPSTKQVLDTERELIEHQFQKMVEVEVEVESPGQPSTQDAARGAVILASSEANAVSRERNNYVHSDNDKPHAHGAFTYHLIEGIDGKAADQSGVITIGSLKKYIEDKMLSEDRQIPVHYVAGATRIDSIQVAISGDRYHATIDKLVSTTQGLIVVKYDRSELTDFQYLTLATKKVGELANLDSNNADLPLLRKVIQDGILAYAQPTSEWLAKNLEYARPRINAIEGGLYDYRLPDMIFNLSYDKLQKMDQTTLKILTTVLAEVARDTEFKADDDPNLNRFYYQLRALVLGSRGRVI
jgi:hypothetical protein